MILQDGRVSEPKNLTEYPSLKESVSIGIDSTDEVHVAFLDNRKGSWQVFLLNVHDNRLHQLTEASSHKEDVFLSIAPDDRIVITWTDLREGKPQLFLIIISPEGEILVDEKVISPDYSCTKASTVVDREKIHVMYLEKRVYDHVIYDQLDFSGESQKKLDLGECIHLDPVKLGIFKGPQFVVIDTIFCVWSDSRTGSHNLYCAEFTETGSIIKDAEQLTHFPVGVQSWMPAIAHLKGSIHIVYLNNAFGHRLFHSEINGGYQERGTLTSRDERATAPTLVGDRKGFLHCIYLRYGEGRNFNLTYRNTYPQEKKEVSFSEKMEESSIRYVYSFALAFLFAFPFAFWDNIIGIILLVGGFFFFRYFNLRTSLSAMKGFEYIFLIMYNVILFLLKRTSAYFLIPVTYETAFVIYGFAVCLGASLVFKFLLGNRFSLGIRILLSSLVFLYLLTLFLLLPVIPHI